MSTPKVYGLLEANIYPIRKARLKIIYISFPKVVDLSSLEGIEKFWTIWLRWVIVVLK